MMKLNERLKQNRVIELTTQEYNKLCVSDSIKAGLHIANVRLTNMGVDNRLICIESKSNIENLTGKYNVIYIDDEYIKCFKISKDGKIHKIKIIVDKGMSSWIEQVAIEHNGSIVIICEDGIHGIVINQ